MCHGYPGLLVKSVSVRFQDNRSAPGVREQVVDRGRLAVSRMIRQDDRFHDGNDLFRVRALPQKIPGKQAGVDPDPGVLRSRIRLAGMEPGTRKGQRRLAGRETGPDGGVRIVKNGAAQPQLIDSVEEKRKRRILYRHAKTGKAGDRVKNRAALRFQADAEAAGQRGDPEPAQIARVVVGTAQQMGAA